MRVKILAADLWNYIRRAFLRWWFLVYSAPIASWEFVAEPLNWPELQLRDYLILGGIALLVGPALAFLELLEEVRTLRQAAEGQAPLMGPGLLFLRQGSRFMHEPPQHLLPGSGGESRRKRPEHMAEIFVRTTQPLPPSLRTYCNAPVYSGLADYCSDADGEAYGARIVPELQARVRFEFAGGEIPAGTVIRLCVGSPMPIAFTKVEPSEPRALPAAPILQEIRSA
jgi:hypothetical protein